MAGEGKRVYSFQEVRKHNDSKDCWLIISGKVYDVTPFMEEHPGGGEVLLACTGKDATADFDDIGHTESAKEMMPQYCIGEVDAATIPATAKLAYAVRDGTTAASTRVKTTGVWLHLLQLAVPVVLLAATLAFQSFSATKADQ